MKANILVYDVGSTYTKGAAFALADGKLTFLARGQHPTTLENISDGARGAEAEIRDKGVECAPDMGRFSPCSAAGGLRMVAMGYMPRVTAKAAKEVAMTAAARGMEVVSADEPPEFREEVLREIKPDIILLSGGTDGGDMANVLENADIICKVHGEGTVILGCNKFAQRAAAEKFSVRLTVRKQRSWCSFMTKNSFPAAGHPYSLSIAGNRVLIKLFYQDA